MKSFHLILFLNVFAATIYSQGQLTDFQGSKGNRVNTLHEVDGIKYHVAIDQLDNISVYRLSGVDDQQLLHSNNFIGISESQSYFQDEYFVFEGNSSLIAYNFVSNIDSEYQLAEGYSVRNIRQAGIHNGKVIARLANDFDDKDYYIGFHIEKGFITEPRDLFGYNLNYEYEYIDSLFVIKDLERNLIDTVLRAEFNGYPIIYADEVIYNLKEGKIMQHTFENGVSVFSNFNSVLEYNSVFDLDIVLGNDFLSYINLDSYEDGIEVKVFDEESGQITLDSIYAIHDWGAYDAIAKNEFIVILGNYNHYVIDTKTKELKMYKTELRDISGLIFDSNDNLINMTSEFIDNASNYYFELIDLVTKNVTRLTGEYEIQSINIDHYQLLEFGNQYLYNIEDKSEKPNSLFEFNLNTYSALTNTSLDNSNSGLSDWSSVVNINGTPTMFGDEIWYIDKENNPIQLYNKETEQIRYQPYVVHDEVLYFVQKDPYKILSWNGEELHEEVDLSAMPAGEFGFNRLEDFAVLSDCAYIMTWAGFYRYDKATANWSHISNANTNGSESALYAYQDYAYYLGTFGAYRMSISGIEEPVAISPTTTTGIGVISNTVFIEFQDHLYIPLDGISVRVNSDNSIEQIFDGEIDIITSFRALDHGGNYYLYAQKDNTLVSIYDGESITSLESIEPMITLEQNSTGGMYFFRGERDYFVNAKTKETDYLPLEIAAWNVLDYFEQGNSSYLLVVDHNAPNSKLIVYKTDSKLSFLDEVTEVQSIGHIWRSTYTKYYNEGLIYSGNKIVFVDEEFQLHPVDDLAGFGYGGGQTTEKDGAVYFLAIDPQNGLQWYTDKLVGFRTSTNNIRSIKTIDIFPNPVSNMLTFNMQGIETSSYKYEIYTLDGRMIMSDDNTNVIDIRKLESGKYAIVLKDQNNVYSAEFVKM